MNALLRFVAISAFVPAIFACAPAEDGRQATATSAQEFHSIEIVIQVPPDTPTVYLTGNVAELGPWDPDGLAMSGDGTVRRASISASADSTFEYKVTLGSWQREAIDESDVVLPNFTLAVTEDQSVKHDIHGFKVDPAVYMADWPNSGVAGTLIYWPDVASEFLSEDRHVEVWLPPGYEENPDRRYPVIYMHDGQNLFDPRIANTGIDWGVDEAMMQGVEAGVFESAIVVGAWSSSRRTEEYSPWHDAPQYARFLIEELLPRVNGEFRTLTGPDKTFVMGSSMGGLLSFYLVKEHADVFGACGCVSTHFPISEAVVASFTGGDADSVDAIPYVARDIANGDTVPEGVRFFFDYGTETLDAEYGPTHAIVREWLLDQGLVEAQDFLIREYEGAAHNEAAWRARLGDQLAWLLADDRK